MNLVTARRPIAVAIIMVGKALADRMASGRLKALDIDAFGPMTVMSVAAQRVRRILEALSALKLRELLIKAAQRNVPILSGNFEN
jgi:hypothetical protein